MNRFLIGGALLALAAVAQGPALAGPANGPTYDVQAFSVAGVQLGMDAEQVAQALTAAGYTVGTSRQYTTFADAVAGEARNRGQSAPRVGKPSGPGSVFGKDAAGNLVVVLFTDTGSSVTASRITQRFHSAPPRAEMRARIQETYGTPSYAGTFANSDNWCLAGDSGCDTLVSSGGPKLYFRWDTGHELTLDNTQAAQRLRRAAVMAVLDARPAERGGVLLSGL